MAKTTTMEEEKASFVVNIAMIKGTTLAKKKKAKAIDAKNHGAETLAMNNTAAITEIAINTVLVDKIIFKSPVLLFI